jgi:outer membrane murein-binding lipoprotein Lpp
MLRLWLIVALYICALGTVPPKAQGTSNPQSAQSDQLFACQQKVNQLSEQVRPLQSKLASLRAERKGIGASGGEVARFKLANVDQEISQIVKQIDSVNGQITSEKRHCDELAGKPATPSPPAASPSRGRGR